MKIHDSIQFPFTLDDEHNNNIFKHFYSRQQIQVWLTHNFAIKIPN